MNANHCKLCDRALYQMRWIPGHNLSQIIHNDKHFYNSDKQEICESCDERLIRRGSQICCMSCHKPIYELSRDMFRERQTTVKDFIGISPQHDPIEGVYNRCVHCNTIVTWG